MTLILPVNSTNPLKTFPMQTWPYSSMITHIRSLVFVIYYTRGLPPFISTTQLVVVAQPQCFKQMTLTKATGYLSGVQKMKGGGGGGGGSLPFSPFRDTSQDLIEDMHCQYCFIVPFGWFFDHFRPFSTIFDLGPRWRQTVYMPIFIVSFDDLPFLRPG